MKLSKDNQHLFTIWCRSRQGTTVPMIPSSVIVENNWIGKNICLQFQAPDERIRFVWAGDEVQQFMGSDLAGKEVTAVFGSDEFQALNDMQRWKFGNPVVIQAHSSMTAENGNMVQVEFLHLPFINHPTGDMLYAVGCSEWTETGNLSSLRAGITERQLLTRTLFNIQTLKPIGTPYSIPLPEKLPDLAKAVAYV